MNFQSVIGRPDLTSRVTPPRTTMLYTQAADTKSQIPTTSWALDPAVTRSFNPSVPFAFADLAVEKFRNERMWKFWKDNKSPM